MENKIHVPLHYITMLLSVVVFCILHTLFRNHGFYTYLVFIPALFLTVNDLNDGKKNERKWAGFWFLFACVHMLPGWLDSIITYTVVKSVILAFFAFFDDCSLIIEFLEFLQKIFDDLYKKYLEKYCKEISNYVKTD